MAVNLRQEARGRECQIRVPGVCNHNPETTVLCHIHVPSLSGGMGKKSHDVFASYGCSACHDFVDGRTGNATIFSRRQYLYEGCFRTQKILMGEGKIGIRD